MSWLNLDKVKSIINASEVKCIFDIGAHNFADSINLKQSFLSAEVYAFEPDKKNILLYEQTATQHGVKVVNLALSDEEGEVLFYNSETHHGAEWTCSGSIFKPVVYEGTGQSITHPAIMYNTAGYPVKTTTLENFCNSQNISPDILHIDAQGAETKIINGLGKYRPRIIFAETCEFDTYETGTDLANFDSLMLDIGYKVFERYQYDTLYVLGS